MDRLRTVQEIAAAQVRLAHALAEELRACAAARGGQPRESWWRSRRAGRSRPAHAVLADQLASLQRSAEELLLWADRAHAERRASVVERERAESEGRLASEAEAAAREKAGEARRALEAVHAQMDGLPGRLDLRYAPLEAQAQELKQAIAAGELEADRHSEVAARARGANAVAHELEQALDRAEQTLRSLHQAAVRAADQVDRALAAEGGDAAARALAEALAVAVKGADPESLEALARDTERFVAERAAAARHR